MNLKFSKSEVLELQKILNSKILHKIDSLNFDIIENIKKRLAKDNSIKLYVDGAANLHSKIAGIGGVIVQNGKESDSFSEFIGQATNNEAEYKALIKGLNLALELKYISINIFADSELVVKQINGEYKVKNERMRKLHDQVISLLAKFEKWSLQYIPRAQNTVADKLSKAGMKKQK